MRQVEKNHLCYLYLTTLQKTHNAREKAREYLYLEPLNFSQMHRTGPEQKCNTTDLQWNISRAIESKRGKKKQKERKGKGGKRESSLYINIFNALHAHCAARARAISHRFAHTHIYAHACRRVRGTMHSTESLTRV